MTITLAKQTGDYPNRSNQSVEPILQNTFESRSNQKARYHQLQYVSDDVNQFRQYNLLRKIAYKMTTGFSVIKQLPVSFISFKPWTVLVIVK